MAYRPRVPASSVGIAMTCLARNGGPGAGDRDIAGSVAVRDQVLSYGVPPTMTCPRNTNDGASTGVGRIVRRNRREPCHITAVTPP